jgi:hypothetical protein
MYGLNEAYRAVYEENELEKRARKNKEALDTGFMRLSPEQTKKESKRLEDLAARESSRLNEFVIESLITNGYVNDYNSAVSIIESMSEEWFESILQEAPWQIVGPDPHGPSDSEKRPIGKPYQNKKRAKKKADEYDEKIGGYRHSLRYVEDQK